jgi:fibronectin-binding autotransporter adhesin
MPDISSHFAMSVVVKNIPSPLQIAVAGSFLAAVLIVPVARAADQTWSNAGSDDFNDGAAWLGGVAPGVGDTAVFSGSAVLNPVLTSSLSIDTLAFTGTATGVDYSYGYNLTAVGGASLTLTGGSAIIGNAAGTATGTNTVGADLVLGRGPNTTQSFSIARGGELHLAGNISESGANTRINLTRGGSALTLESVFTFSGSNSFSGGINYANSSVTVNLNHAHAIGTGAISATAGTIRLDNTSGSALTLATNNAIAASADITFFGSNDLNFGNGAVTLLGGTRTITVAANTLTLEGIIGDGGAGLGLVKAGAGSLQLTGVANTYSGSTAVTVGILQVTKLSDGGVASSIGQSSSAAGNLAIFNAATLRYVGTGDTTDRLFSISNGSVGSTIDSSGSGALVFTNTGTIGHHGNLANARILSLAGTNTGTNTVAAVVTNATGATGVIKNGSGRWILTGANTYTGNTVINDGALEAVDGVGLSANSTLQLRGGVFQSNGTFSRDVTTSAGGVNWGTGSGGFAARGGTLNVQLNGGTGSLTWNGSSFVSTGQSLIFGSTSADSLVDFQNAINLGSSGAHIRTITVIDNAASTSDVARISGAITNTLAGQSLRKDGDGVLELTANSTYSGTTIVADGTLILTGTLGNTSAITVESGATFAVNGLTSNSAGVTVAGRLSGAGIVGGNTVITGQLNPGNSEGLLTFSSALTLSGDAALTTLEITGVGRGVTGGYDAIDGGANQLLTYDGTLTLSMTGLIADGTYDLFSFTDGFQAGGFDLLVFAGGAYSGTWMESGPGVWTVSAAGQSFTFTESTGDLLVAAVPEPSAVLLCGAAGVSLIFARRRRREC